MAERLVLLERSIKKTEQHIEESTTEEEKAELTLKRDRLQKQLAKLSDEYADMMQTHNQMTELGKTNVVEAAKSLKQQNVSLTPLRL